MDAVKHSEILTKKHRLFVEAYAGDEISAMLAAGFQGAPEYLKVQGQNLLKNPLIIEAIKARSRYLAKTFHIIADRDERLATLTAIMRNEDPHRKEELDASGMPIPETNIPLQTRLKATELLGKAFGDFIDNVNISGNVSITDLVTQSYAVKQTADEIEAEFKEIKDQQAPKPLPEPSKLSEFI